MCLYIVLGILIFIFLPWIIDEYFMGLFVTNWGISDWAGFLGSYIGGIIGALITLVGVYWQIKRDDKLKNKEKIIGVLKGILYSLNKNLETQNLESINKNSFYVLDYYYSDIVYSEFSVSHIYPIFPEIIKENYKVIFELDFGNDIIELDELIKDFNKNHYFLSLQLANKKEIIREIENKLKENKIDNSPEIRDTLENIKNKSLSFSYICNHKREKKGEEEILDLGKKLEKELETLVNELGSVEKKEIFEKEINTLLKYMLSEEVILSDHNNIFEVLKKIRNLKGKIVKEIEKIENN